MTTHLRGHLELGFRLNSDPDPDSFERKKKRDWIRATQNLDPDPTKKVRNPAGVD